MKERIETKCKQCGNPYFTYIRSNGLPHRMFCTRLCSQRNRLPKMHEAWKAKKGPRPVEVPPGTLCACGCGEPLVSSTVWDCRRKRPRIYLAWHHARKQKMSVQCLQCRKEFLVTPWESRRRKFCSKSCGSTYYQTGKIIADRLTIDCPVCGKPFELKRSEYESLRKITCSQKCGAKLSGARRIGIGDAVSPVTHRRHLADIRPPIHCEKCGYNKLPGILHMHHRDGNPTNGAIPNLEWICPNCHMELHWINKTGPFAPRRDKGRKQISLGVLTQLP